MLKTLFKTLFCMQIFTADSIFLMTCLANLKLNIHITKVPHKPNLIILELKLCKIAQLFLCQFRVREKIRNARLSFWGSKWQIVVWETLNIKGRSHKVLIQNQGKNAVSRIFGPLWILIFSSIFFNLCNPYWSSFKAQFVLYTAPYVLIPP